MNWGKSRLGLHFKSFLAMSVGASLSTSLFSQNPDNSEPDLEQNQEDTIIITGSRISRIDSETPQPVQVYTQQDLKNAGVNSLDDFALYLPINQPAFGANGAGFGANDFNYEFRLRVLGTGTTLTLTRPAICARFIAAMASRCRGAT